MFLRACWARILGNMLYLWVFGSHIERSMGHLRYLGFYLACGLGANALSIGTAVTSNVPGLGASGAIAGVLGAYHVLYPTSTVRTLLPRLGDPHSPAGSGVPPDCRLVSLATHLRRHVT